MILNGHTDPNTNSTAKPRSKPMPVQKTGQLAMHIFYPHS
jgi:hypothetical protein